MAKKAVNKNADNLPHQVYVARNWDEAEVEAGYVYDFELKPEKLSKKENSCIVGVYELVDYIVVKNETTIVPSKNPSK